MITFSRFFIFLDSFFFFSLPLCFFSSPLCFFTSLLCFFSSPLCFFFMFPFLLFLFLLLFFSLSSNIFRFSELVKTRADVLVGLMAIFTTDKSSAEKTLDNVVECYSSCGPFFVASTLGLSFLETSLSGVKLSCATDSSIEMSFSPLAIIPDLLESSLASFSLSQ